MIVECDITMWKVIALFFSYVLLWELMKLGLRKWNKAMRKLKQKEQEEE